MCKHSCGFSGSAACRACKWGLWGIMAYRACPQAVDGDAKVTLLAHHLILQLKGVRQHVQAAVQA